MNSYYGKIKFVKTKLIAYLDEIFKKYDYELLLNLGDYNLLQSEDNCLQSSTATGYILEEFVVSKLESYTRNHNGDDEIKVERTHTRGTQKSSYDCFVNYKDVFFMINFKAEKKYNNGIAAINILHSDYAVKDPDKEKSYLALKTNYCFDRSANTGERKIFVKDVYVYSLEEIDFTAGHKQDHRNWSSEFKSSSGRLQVSKTFRKNNVMKEEEISYQKTKRFIEIMYNDGN